MQKDFSHAGREGVGDVLEMCEGEDLTVINGRMAYCPSKATPVKERCSSSLERTSGLLPVSDSSSSWAHDTW